MLPSLAQPSMQRDYRQGSGSTYVPLTTARGQQQQDSSHLLIIFGLIVIVAVYYKF